MLCYRVTVHGRVQGVWYRDSCRREAISAGVAGWVCNNPDGTVGALLEGEAPGIERLLVWMRHGPPSAVVTRVEANPQSPTGAKGFEIR